MVDVAPDDADLGEDENGIGVETEIFPASLVYELARDSQAELTHSKDELFQSINMEAFADDILHDAEEDAYDYFQDFPTHDDVIAFLQEVTDDFLEAYDYQLSYAEAVDPRREDVEKNSKDASFGYRPDGSRGTAHHAPVPRTEQLSHTPTPSRPFHSRYGF